jgi:hypothetical protein
MATLGNFFSEEDRKKFAEANITPGTVLKCFVKNTNPPKEKRFVVLGTDREGNLIGVVFLNTNINWKVIRTFDLQKLQYYIEADQNDFIDRDCYIDCSEIIELSKEDVLAGITKSPGNVLGKVSDEQLNTIIGFIRQSPKITPKVRKKYGIN